MNALYDYASAQGFSSINHPSWSGNSAAILPTQKLSPLLIRPLSTAVTPPKPNWLQGPPFTKEGFIS